MQVPRITLWVGQDGPMGLQSAHPKDVSLQRSTELEVLSQRLPKMPSVGHVSRQS